MLKSHKNLLDFLLNDDRKLRHYVPSRGYSKSLLNDILWQKIAEQEEVKRMYQPII